jgi:hypothetical protein
VFGLSHLNRVAHGRESDINPASTQVLCIKIGMFAVDRDENFGFYSSSHLKQVRAAGMAGGM